MSVRYVLMFERDLPKAIHFFKKGIGASVKVATEGWAELQAGDTTLALKETPGCVLTAFIVYSCINVVVTTGTSCPGNHYSNVHVIDSFAPVPNCREAYCTTGYSPLIVFNVPDLQGSLTTMLQLGAHMDGAVQYTVEGSKV